MQLAQGDIRIPHNGLTLLLQQIIDIALSCSTSVGVAKGIGTHLESLDQISGAVLLTLITVTISLYTFTLPKLAISVLLQRLLVPSRRLAWTLHAMAISLIMLAIVCTFIIWLRCDPPAAQWHPLTMQANCHSLDTVVNLYIVLGAYSAFIDLVYAFYPGIIIVRLQMPMLKKIGLISILGLGILLV